MKFGMLALNENLGHLIMVTLALNIPQQSFIFPFSLPHSVKNKGHSLYSITVN